MSIEASAAIEAVTHEIVGELGDRTILPAGLYLEYQEHAFQVEPTSDFSRGRIEFLAMGNGVRNPVQVRVTVEVLP